MERALAAAAHRPAARQAEEDNAPEPKPANQDSVAPPGARNTADAIFDRVANATARTWSVDTSDLPRERRAASGCVVDDQDAKFVPVRGIRLTRGNYTQIGVPYAQASLHAFDRFMQKTANAANAKAEFTTTLANVQSKVGNVPGNLDDNFEGDIGIDCSALIQLAWDGRAAEGRLATETLQSGAVSYRCANRLPHADFLRGGDAIGINVDPGPHHVVMYAEPLVFDGANVSWLVLESASACDGVCWSVYDPSFFNGWGIYRAANRGDFKCVARKKESTLIAEKPIPHTLQAWRDMVRSKTP